jgi:hypothetical protein
LEGCFEVSNWSEEVAPGGRDDASGVTVARYEERWTGDIDGEARCDVVISNEEGVGARFVGFQRVVGSSGDRQGSFVLQTAGVVSAAGLRATAEVVPGSGRDGFATLRGRASMVSLVDGKPAWTLDCSFE